ncbi:MAG: DNA polymerase III subunit gamma/tau [Chloroflexi bacterium]|nr:DNA polymerase III subunit gamma/tau [Chloroflexota bacterium]
MSQVFYRKWRPQSLSEIAGQEHVTRTLLQALATGRIAHAYLFSGPRGTGKTSTGRILAKAVNCLSNGHGEPCNQCVVCQAIAQGNSMDVVEIDAASNRGIDDIRSLRERVAFVPGSARYKVYIIDEVHMLSEPAANALLKTLEEPPAHVIFVLATTDPQKLPATILSRCQHFQFHRITGDAVTARLAFICEKEAITAPSEALRLIARSSTGSLRDAANLLQQTVAYYGSEFSLDQVKELLGLTGDARARELARHILHKDLSAGLDAINQANSDGLDLRQFLRTAVNYLREMLLLKAGAPEAIEATPEDKAEMRALADAASLDTILRAVKAFSQIDLRMDNYSTLPLELALADSILPEEKHDAASAVEDQVRSRPQAVAAPLRSESPHSGPARPAPRPPQPAIAPTRTSPPSPSPTAPPSVEPRPEPRPVAPIRAEPVVASNAVPPPVVREPAPAASSSLPKESHAGGSAGFMPGAAPCPAPPPPGTPPLDHLRQHWREFINSLRGEGSTGTLDALLRNACEPVTIEGDNVVLGFYWPLHKEKIEDPKYCFLVERKLNQFLGGAYKLRCVLTEKKRRPLATHSASSPSGREQAGQGSPRAESSPGSSTGSPRTEQAGPTSLGTGQAPAAGSIGQVASAGPPGSNPSPLQSAPRAGQPPDSAGAKKSPSHLVEAALREGGRIISTEEK